jgi:hypothetical protein
VIAFPVGSSLFERVLQQVTGNLPEGGPAWCIAAREVIRVALDAGDEEVTSAMLAAAEADPEGVVVALAGGDVT